MPQLTTYSGISLNFSLIHPLIGTIHASGVSAKGIKSVSVRMATEHSNMQVGMDGAVVTSVVPGEQGEIEILVWQTSTLHQEFLAWYNAVLAAMLAGDVAPWFAATVIVMNTTDGSLHTCTGVAPRKVPDKQYQEQAQPVAWMLSAANIINE